MSTDYTCKRPANQIIITFLEREMNKRIRRNHAPQQPVPWKKAMKAIAKTNVIIKNESHAKAIADIGPEIANVIKNGLIRVGKYRKGNGSWNETQYANRIIRQQINDQVEQRRKAPKRIRINKVYIPRKHTATRAMFEVLAESHINNENGLERYMIINRARHLTNVDMTAKYDTNRLYDAWKGLTGTLIQKGYVVRKRGKLYEITDKGFQVYKKHCQSQQNGNNNNRNDRDDDGVQLQQNENFNRNHNVNNNINVDYDIYGDDKDLQKAIFESQKSVVRTQQNRNNNINNNINVYDEQLQLQNAILESKESYKNESK
eukprot:40254_1